MGRYNLKYKTFDQLLAEVRSDLDSYNVEGLIKPESLLKVAKKINYSLGLRIHKTKNIVLNVEKGRAKLPNDFNILNYMYVLGQYEVSSPVIHGTHVEERPLNPIEYHPGSDTIDICATDISCPEPEPECPDPCQAPDPCGCNTCGCNVYTSCSGEDMQLIQKLKYQTRKWTEFYKIKLVNTDSSFYDPKCPNQRWMASNTAFIKGGFIYTSFKEGDLYISYQGMMEDEDGNILVLDHDMINEYYEFALQERILKNLVKNGYNVSNTALQIVMGDLKAAKNTALGIVNTPDYKEMKAVYEANRKAMYNKYYKMFH